MSWTTMIIMGVIYFIIGAIFCRILIWWASQQLNMVPKMDNPAGVVITAIWPVLAALLIFLLIVETLGAIILGNYADIRNIWHPIIQMVSNKDKE